MNQRTKMLGGLFGAAVVVALMTNVVYPRWVQPLTTLDERIASARRRLAELEAEEERIEAYRKEYRALVARIGTFDIDRAATDVRDRINALIERHKLHADSVSPSRARKDRKTGIESMTINVKAVGPLESAIAFLTGVYELPQLMRVGNVALYRGSRRGNERGPTPMNLRVPIEIRVLPQQKIVGRIELDELEQPERLVRHEPRDYSPIWAGTPFDDWVPPVPLRVEIRPSKTAVNQGERLWLQGNATGGVGDYSFAWSPTDRLKSPDRPRTEVETDEAGQWTYTLTATDEKGESASSTVTIRVLPKREPVARNPDTPRRPPPPPPRPDARWSDRTQRQLVMTLGRSGAGGRHDELMISNRRTRTTEYYTVGDEFDGGVLVAVHQTGGLVRRKDDPRNPEGEAGYFVYPIGATLDQDIPLAEADAFPELQRMAEADKAALHSAAAEKQAGASQEVQPRGVEEPPLQIGLVKRQEERPTPQAVSLPDEKGEKKRDRGTTDEAAKPKPANRRGRRPVRGPK